LGLDPRVGQAGKTNWKTKQDCGAVDKETSVPSVIDTGCKINRVNWYRLWNKHS